MTKGGAPKSAALDSIAPGARSVRLAEASLERPPRRGLHRHGIQRLHQHDEIVEILVTSGGGLNLAGRAGRGLIPAQPPGSRARSRALERDGASLTAGIARVLCEHRSARHRQVE